MSKPYIIFSLLITTPENNPVIPRRHTVLCLKRLYVRCADVGIYRCDIH